MSARWGNSGPHIRPLTESRFLPRLAPHFSNTVPTDSDYRSPWVRVPTNFESAKQKRSLILCNAGDPHLDLSEIPVDPRFGDFMEVCQLGLEMFLNDRVAFHLSPHSSCRCE